MPVALLLLSLRQRPRSPELLFAAGVEFLFLSALGHIDSVFAIILLALYGALFTIDYSYYRRLGSPVSASLLRLALREPANTRLVLTEEFGLRDSVLLAAVLGMAVLPAVLGRKGQYQIAAYAVASVSALILAAAMARLPSVTPALNLIRGLIAALRLAALKPHTIGPVQRRPFPDVPAQPSSCNILVVILESACARILNSPEGREAAPQYHRFQASHAERITAFPHALSNSATSDVSYPSILTGLSPEQPVELFCRNPLLSAAAKAAGRHTSFYSSQSLKWANLQALLIDDSWDHTVHRDVLQAPAVNDLSMNDRDLNSILLAELPQRKTPFFSVVNYNMLHYPFLGDQGLRAFKAGEHGERYLSALAVFDRCFGDLVQALADAGQLAHTAILFTADHGENPSVYKRTADHKKDAGWVGRLYDFQLDYLNVPFWIMLPAGAEAVQLGANSGATVSNVDLYPTVLDLLGYGKMESLALPGVSLLQPVPAERSIVSLNTGGLRVWEMEPFAIARGGDLLIYHDLTRSFELIDLADPQIPDRWPLLPFSEKQQWMAHAQSFPAIDKIVSSRNLAEGLLASSKDIAAEYDRLASLGKTADLHQLDNWRLFSKEDWDDLCLRTAALIGLRDGDRVFESGCGAGAFLDTLRRHYRIEVAGADFSGKLIDIARQRVPGQFWTADVQHLPFIENESYDCVVSHGVFLYLTSIEAAERAAGEMVRITKAGGAIYVGVVNDPDRLEAYRASHGQQPSGNYLLRRAFWQALAEREALDIRIVNQDEIYAKPEGYDGHSRLRYSVFLRKNGGALPASSRV
ncbi:MAG: sulfatase-like hydrolase/transferase [Bryobacteraceae bacterium]